MATFHIGDTVYHETFGPGTVKSLPSDRVVVAFRAGRGEPFRLPFAEQVLQVCPPDGFLALLLKDEVSALRVLTEAPNQAFAGLSADLGREVTRRNAKAVLKTLKVVPEKQLDLLWSETLKALKRPSGKKERVHSKPGEGITVSSDADATEVGLQLWDTNLHVTDRSAIYDALEKHFLEHWSEDFFLEASIAPVPSARSRAYKVLKARSVLSKLWEFLVRKTATNRTASGIIEGLLRLLEDASSIPGLDYRIAGDVFLKAQQELPAPGERLDRIQSLLSATTAPRVRLAKEVLAHLPPGDLTPLLRNLSSTEREALIRLRCDDAVAHDEERGDPRRLLDFIRFVAGRITSSDVRRLAEAALSAQRLTYARQVLAAGTEALTSQADSASQLESLRDWLLQRPDLASTELRRLFDSAGLPLAAPVRPMEPADHERRLVDATVPLRLRLTSLTQLAPSLRDEDVPRLLSGLVQEAGEAGRQLAASLWTERATRNEDVTKHLVEVSLHSPGRALIFSWLLDTGRLRPVESELPGLLSSLVLPYSGHGLPSEIRDVLIACRDSSIGPPTRQALFEVYLENCKKEVELASGGLREALVALGVSPDLLTTISACVREFTSGISRLEEELHAANRSLEQFPSSEQFVQRVRQEVDLAVQSKLVEARAAADMGRARLTRDLAAWALDFAVLVDAITNPRTMDVQRVAPALLERLVSFLEERFGIRLVGSIGDEVSFDPGLHEGQASPGERVVLLRPLLVDKSTGKPIERAPARRR